MQTRFTILLFVLSISQAFTQTIVYDTIHSDNIKEPYVRILGSDTLVSSNALPVGYTDESFPKELFLRIKNAKVEHQDNVVLKIFISKTGEVTRITVLKGKYQDCINESIKIIKSFKKWNPCVRSYKGKRFYDDFSYTIPFQFK